MSDTPENFDELQKAMKLARYEVPPPGFFNNFSSKVISRIESESESARSKSSKPDVAWLARFLRLLETNPFAAGAFGFTVCGMLIGGIAWSEYQEPMANSSTEIAGADVTGASGASSSGAMASLAATSQSVTPSLDPTLTGGMPGNLFNNFDQLNVKQVNYAPAAQ